jgi:hypothetical protein
VSFSGRIRRSSTSYPKLGKPGRPTGLESSVVDKPPTSGSATAVDLRIVGQNAGCVELASALDGSVVFQRAGVERSSSHVDCPLGWMASKLALSLSPTSMQTRAAPNRESESLQATTDNP